MISFGDNNKYGITMSSRFKRGIKQAKKRGCDLELLKPIVHNLANDIPLDEKHHDHQLIGDYKDFRECHITPDWLLVYEKTEETLTLYLFETGTHSDLFK